MRKLAVLILMIGLCFAGSKTGIRETMDNAYVRDGYQFYVMEIRSEAQATTSSVSALVWYADNIVGYSVIGIDGFEASSGNVPTTISAQAVYADGTDVSVAAQIITAGTDLTDFKSAYYKFTLPAGIVTRNISAFFIIAD